MTYDIFLYRLCRNVQKPAAVLSLQQYLRDLDDTLRSDPCT